MVINVVAVMAGTMPASFAATARVVVGVCVCRYYC